MAKPGFSDVEQLLIELIFPFYAIKRDIHVPPYNRRLENDAEHSWSLALVACAMAPHLDPKLDIGKVAQMALVHDLVEVYAGDTSVWKPRMVASKEKREKAALHRVKSASKQFPWIYETLEHYETKSSQEAKFVWALDKYMALFTRYINVNSGSRYFIRRKMNIATFEKGISIPRNKARAHMPVSNYYEELIAKFFNNTDWFFKA